MDDDEILARFSGLRVALAYAIKATCRSPGELGHHRDALREIERLIPRDSHPAIKEELDGVIRALTKLPVRDPTHEREAPAAHEPSLHLREVDSLSDLLP